MKYKSQVEMTEGTVPFPQTSHPLAMVPYYLFSRYRILRGAGAAGVKPP